MNAIHAHPHGSAITAQLEAWAGAADAEDQGAPANDERNRKWLELAAKAPLRSKGRTVADAAHLPLFVAGNEPVLPL